MLIKKLNDSSLKHLFSKLELIPNGIKNYAILKEISRRSHSALLNLLSVSKGSTEILMNTQLMLEKIPKEPYEHLYLKYKDVDPYPGYSKYLEAGVHIARAIRNAKKLDLCKNESGTLDILDIGSGAGYFPFVCKHYNHQAMAIDLPDNPMYNEMKNLLGVECLHYAILPFQVFPPLEKKFDLITGFQILFDRPRDQSPWGSKEWTFFLKDIRKILKPEARVFLELNTYKPEEEIIFKENIQFLKSIGAHIVGHEVLIENKTLMFE